MLAAFRVSGQGRVGGPVACLLLSGLDLCDGAALFLVMLLGVVWLLTRAGAAGVILVGQL